jgi:small nuclear ribonucleoprotein (snRNP)-like protein
MSLKIYTVRGNLLAFDELWNRVLTDTVHCWFDIYTQTHSQNAVVQIHVISAARKDSQEHICGLECIIKQKT